MQSDNETVIRAFLQSQDDARINHARTKEEHRKKTAILEEVINKSVRLVALRKEVTSALATAPVTELLTLFSANLRLQKQYDSEPTTELQKQMKESKARTTALLHSPENVRANTVRRELQTVSRWLDSPALRKTKDELFSIAEKINLTRIPNHRILFTYPAEHIFARHADAFKEEIDQPIAKITADFHAYLDACAPINDLRALYTATEYALDDSSHEQAAANLADAIRAIIQRGTCPICCQDDDPRPFCATKCAHAFHCHCIKTWLRLNSTCPACRAPVMVTQLRNTTGK